MSKRDEVEKAICCPGGCRHSDTCGSHNSAEEARAAIGALMEPSEAMLEAGMAVMPTHAVWQAMLKAAEE